MSSQPAFAIRAATISAVWRRHAGPVGQEDDEAGDGGDEGRIMSLKMCWIRTSTLREVRSARAINHDATE